MVGTDCAQAKCVEQPKISQELIDKEYRNRDRLTSISAELRSFLVRLKNTDPVEEIGKESPPTDTFCGTMESVQRQTALLISDIEHTLTKLSKF